MPTVTVKVKLTNQDDGDPRRRDRSRSSCRLAVGRRARSSAASRSATEPGLGALTIPGYLREVADASPSARRSSGARRSGVVRWTYATLWERSVEVARALIACGVGKDGRVGILMTNRPEYLAAVFGTALAGGVIVDAQHVLDAAGARAPARRPPASRCCSSSGSVAEEGLRRDAARARAGDPQRRARAARVDAVSVPAPPRDGRATRRARRRDRDLAATSCARGARRRPRWSRRGPRGAARATPARSSSRPDRRASPRASSTPSARSRSSGGAGRALMSVERRRPQLDAPTASSGPATSRW